jgi:hypothetical protein
MERSEARAVDFIPYCCSAKRKKPGERVAGVTA